MCKKPVLTSSHLFKLQSKVDAIAKHQMSSGKFHCCIVMLLIDKLEADAMHQINDGKFHYYCQNPPLSYELTLMWYSAIKLTAPGVESPII